MNSDSGWNERFLASTRGRIVSMLRRSTGTVNELATTLGLTDNAVRAHLTALERDGLVKRRGSRRAFRKPEQIYELTPAAGQFFPKAHELLLTEVIRALKDRDEHGAKGILEAVGRKMATTYAAGVAGADRAKRTAAALKALDDIGGVAESISTDRGQAIRGSSCPLGSLPADHPEACLIAEALLTEILGVPVHEHCERGQTSHCCFHIDDTKP